jgi:hypothetical protein
MFVIYIYIYEQYNLETARQNTSKLKYFIPIKKRKHLPNKTDRVDNIVLNLTQKCSTNTHGQAFPSNLITYEV